MRRLYSLIGFFALFIGLFFSTSSQSYALSSCAKTFQDLGSTSAIYIPAIGCLNQKYCVVTGTEDGYLNAGVQITRAEAIAFVTRYHIEVLQDDWKNVNVSSLPQYFSDVPPSYGLYKEIEIAKAKSFISGYEDGTFNPGGAWTAGYQGPNRSDYNFSLTPADQQSRGGFLKSMYDKSPQYCSAPTYCTDQNNGGRPNGLCSSNYGCKRAQPYYSSTPDCNTPINQPAYTTDQSCPAVGSDPRGTGANVACAPLPPTATPTPRQCPSRCSKNQGCMMASAYTISSGDCDNAPVFAQAPTYTPNASCGPLPGVSLDDPSNVTCKQFAPPTPTPTSPPSDGTVCSDIANANGYVKMVYTPTASGTYTVWTRMIGASATSSVYIQIGDQCNVVVGGAGISTSAWQWVNYRDGNAASKFTVNLQQGKNYTIHVVGRDSGVKVDLIKLDNTGCAQLEGIDGHCAPTSLNKPAITFPTGQTSSGNQTITWTQSSSATKYDLRIDDQADGNMTSCANARPANSTSPDLCSDNVTSTSYQFNFVAGHTYKLWVSAKNDAGLVSPNSDTVTVVVLTPSTPPPTNTPVPPTVTPVPNSTILDMQFILHAIGAGGDNSNPNGGGGNFNLKDEDKVRDVTVQLYNTSNQLVIEKTGKVNFYNPELGIPELVRGAFNGRIDLGTNIQTGDYTIRVKTPNYLRRSFPTTIHIISGQTNELTPITLIAGDIDNNNKLDLFDYQILSGCYGDFTTPDPAICSAAQRSASDINKDGNVNYIDLNYFIRELAVQSGDTTQ